MHGILQARILERLPFPSPGGLPNQGIEPRSPALQADSLPSEPQSAPGLVFADYIELLYRASPSLAAKNIISLISVSTIW